MNKHRYVPVIVKHFYHRIGPNSTIVKADHQAFVSPEKPGKAFIQIQCSTPKPLTWSLLYHTNT